MHGEVSQFTQLLEEARQGDPHSAKAIFPLVYDALREMARGQLLMERAGHTLQATALVHEAYVKLTAGTPGTYNGRGHFLRAAAEAMRRILVDHAKARGRVKRGGKIKIEQLNKCSRAINAQPEEILTIEEAICRLEEQDPKAAAIVRMRFYAGLTLQETAEASGVSVATVVREWAFARACLFRYLAEGHE